MPDGRFPRIFAVAGGSRGRDIEILEAVVVPLLLVLLLALLLFGAGFAVKVLWLVAVIVLVVWLVGFVARGAHPSGGRHRWYRW